jgi:hypothetical protein
MEKINVIVKETLVAIKVVQVELTPEIEGNDDLIHNRAKELAYVDGYMSNEDNSLGGWTITDCLEVNYETTDVEYS